MKEKSMNNSSESNWERVDAMTDDDIDATEIPPLAEGFFRRARVRMPKQRVSVEIDADLLTWFRGQGENYERKMNAALRIYMEAHRAS